MSDQRGPQGLEAPVVDEGNSINIEASEASVAKTNLDAALSFAKFCISFDNANYKQLLETWSIIETLTWEASATVGTKIHQEDYPSYAVKKLASYPQMLPFKMYQYWRGDIEIRITVAGSPFAIGQCQAWWYYDKYHDISFDQLRSNQYSRSQMIHTLLDPSASNDGVLVLKYRAYRSFLHTRDVPDRDQGPSLNMGTFGIHVLNQLRVPNECTSSVSLVIHVRFPNSSFQGRIYSGI